MTTTGRALTACAVTFAALAATPAPASAEQSQACGWGTYSFLNMPGACWRPYSGASPFNRVLPKAPKLVRRSRAIARRTVAFGAGPRWNSGEAFTSDDWSVPVYFPLPTDPLYRVSCTKARWGTCDPQGMRIRIPAAARPSGARDGHLAVIEQYSGHEYDFWQARKAESSHALTASYGGVTAIGGGQADGLGSEANAGSFGLAAGQIRASELAAGEIDHALFMTVRCTNGKSVWPAQRRSSGRPCARIGLPNADAPAMGQHFFLRMSAAQIAALPVAQWQKTVLTAMARYGMYVGDTGGDGWGLEPESPDPWVAFGRPDPWVTLGQQLGVPSYLSSDGEVKYLFDLRSIVPYGSELAVATPCVARGTC